MFGMLYNMRSPHGANLDIWGKWDDSAAGYPLLGHLLDSALMGEILFEEWLPSRLIKQIDAAVAGSTMTSREIVMLAAGILSSERGVRRIWVMVPEWSLRQSTTRERATYDF